MKRYILILLLFATITHLSAQHRNIDSLKHDLEINQNDTLKLYHFMLLSEAYEETNLDSAFYYAKNELTLARKLKLRLNEAIALNAMAYDLKNKGNYPASLQTYLSAKEIAEDTKVEENILPNKYYHLEGFSKKPVTARMIRLQILGFTHLGLGLVYGDMNNYEKALFYERQVMNYAEQDGDARQLIAIYLIIGRLNLALEKLDSALIFEQKAYDLSIQIDNKQNLGSILLNLGRIQLALGNKRLAIEYFRESLTISRKQAYLRGMVAGNLMLYDVYQQEGKKDSSLYFAHSALGYAEQMNSPDLLLRVYTALAAFYRSSEKNDSAVKYQELIIEKKDSLFNAKQAQQFQNIAFDEEQRQQDIEVAKNDYRDRVLMYGLLMGLLIFILVAFLLWKNNRYKQKAYVLLKKQKQETDFQKGKVEQTLEELKSTQSHLIQTEKMASLGELTAGIAHEIQNPLNFVNNFSELNKELIKEIQDERRKEQGQRNEKLELELLKDIEDNSEKINHHGKRADAIVKGMLQHSRSSSGVKEATDINALADEYLRLAYHGLRAKDKSFYAKFETHLDPTLPKLNVVPQDIGRVVLNLINNAFYAVNQQRPTNNEQHNPLVIVSTKNLGNKIEIRVEDNGNGIPQKVLDKIFQPFFTTKPTGQGTGLGLSLSYDIVKAHNGELKVETKEGEGSEFVINIPLV